MQLSKWLEKNRTCPDILQFLIQDMDQLRRDKPVTRSLDPMFDGLMDVFETHEHIGWKTLLGGCISSQWARVQDQYLKWIESKKLGKRWASVLIKKL